MSLFFLHCQHAFFYFLKLSTAHTCYDLSNNTYLRTYLHTPQWRRMALSFDDPTNVPVTVAVVGKYTTQVNASLFLQPLVRYLLS